MELHKVLYDFVHGIIEGENYGQLLRVEPRTNLEDLHRTHDKAHLASDIVGQLPPPDRGLCGKGLEDGLKLLL